MRIQRKVEVKRASEFMQSEMGFRFDCKLYTSIDYGQTFYHCGYGRFCKTEEEAVDYVNNQTDMQTVAPGFMDGMESYQTEAFQFPCDREIC